MVHEVFLKLLADEEVRRSFRDGAFGAWLVTVARNQARAFLNKYRKEQLVEPEVLAGLAGGHTDAHEARFELRKLVEEFQRRLPAKWAPVFEARFIRQLDQRTAAAALGMHRTTLAYREMVIRRRLRRFLLREEDP